MAEAEEGSAVARTLLHGSVNDQDGAGSGLQQSVGHTTDDQAADGRDASCAYHDQVPQPLLGQLHDGGRGIALSDRDRGGPAIGLELLETTAAPEIAPTSSMRRARINPKASMPSLWHAPVTVSG